MVVRLVEVYPERQGRPDSKVSLDMETRRPSIPIRSITISMLGVSVTQGISAGITSTYGTAKYGRSKYTTRPGIYGYDIYGSCTYN